ncbi:Transposable element Tc3 transposase like protein [Argiope bruennichi]|uniref:Transposable element Tc3 transposase like protein n=1 Tax=Argiope bruennichi TaxID=94029 RepID=A0A8T0F0T6_ARGBR|nr:Transposable element Tc3 transposase like protein [Argiope bruennichi]
MGKGKKLTDRERGQIEALSSTGMSSRAIAIKIGRSKTVVNNFFKLKDNYGKKNTGGRPKALSSRDERRVCQLASTGKYSTRKLIPTTGLKVCQKTIYNRIRRSGRFTYTAKLTKPQLLQRHKIERLNFDQKVMPWDNQWNWMVMSEDTVANQTRCNGEQRHMQMPLFVHFHFLTFLQIVYCKRRKPLGRQQPF